jgi:hypothetical protein
MDILDTNEKALSSQPGPSLNSAKLPEINEFLKQCLSYPSGDNCQPFRFRILSNNSFEIYHNQEISKHRLNFSNLASYVSFGTLLETISLVGKKYFLTANMEIHLPPFSAKIKSEKWAVVRLESSQSKSSHWDLKLAETLNLRATDRGAYRRDHLLAEDVEWLNQEASKNPHLKFSFQHQLSVEFKKAIFTIEEEFWKDMPAVKEVLRWIRFSKRAIQETKDGMSWGSLQLSFLQKPVLMLCQKFPIFAKVGALLGATKSQRNALKGLIKNTGGFGWLALSQHDPLHAVSAGRTYFRMWLYLNNRGYGFQPLTLATLPSFHSHFFPMPTDWPKKLLNIYPKTLRTLQRDSQFNATWVPLIGFRTGLSSPLPAQARSPRKDLDSVTLTSMTDK